MNLAAAMQTMGRKAREAATDLRMVRAEVRSAAIRGIAAALRDRAADILAANAADVAEAKVLVDRLALNPARLEAIAAALDRISDLPDPVGEETARWRMPNGLDIARVRTPIGVIGMIFESRPNVAADAAALCIRSGNALILRGGSDALRSCVAIQRAITAGLVSAGLPEAAVQMVATADRDAVGMMLAGLDGAIDLIVPRGGKALVARVEAEARVPVLGHLEGLCHTYVHAAADPDMAASVLLNAKLRRVSVCGATETLLIDRAVAPQLLPILAEQLHERGCVLRGDDESRALVPEMAAASEADWSEEYLAPILAVGIVGGLDEALAHIARYGSGHTDAIVTADEAAAKAFLERVDSAIVIWNASTQFADGGEFGFGGEIGIGTGKLHARGPVGVEQLTTFKYVVRGSGQTRP